MDDILKELSAENADKITILSGCAKGADTLGEKWFNEHRAFPSNWHLNLYPADWDKHGKAAGPIRNEEMANNADMCVVFWDAKSKGSAHMIKVALKKGLLVKVVYYGEDK
jgi:hypothetical protein